VQPVQQPIKFVPLSLSIQIVGSSSHMSCRAVNSNFEVWHLHKHMFAMWMFAGGRCRLPVDEEVAQLPEAANDWCKRWAVFPPCLHPAEACHFNVHSTISRCLSGSLVVATSQLAMVWQWQWCRAFASSASCCNPWPRDGYQASGRAGSPVINSARLFAPWLLCFVLLHGYCVCCKLQNLI
jgi:hypothetical protein